MKKQEHMYMDMYIYIYTCVYLCIYIHIIHVYVGMYVCMHACMHGRRAMGTDEERAAAERSRAAWGEEQGSIGHGKQGTGEQGSPILRFHASLAEWNRSHPKPPWTDYFGYWSP